MGSDSGTDKDKNENLVDSKNPKSGQYDATRQRTLGYNDFLKGGLYGEYEGEPKSDQPDYEKRRAEWNSKAKQKVEGKRDTSEISDQGVRADRAQRAAASRAQNEENARSDKGLNSDWGLGGSVGPQGLNASPDVTKVQDVLVEKGNLDEATGFIGTKTDLSIKGFQQANSLKVDGQINPGGLTEKALLGNRPGVTSPLSQAPAGTPSPKQEMKTWAESLKRQQQAQQVPQSATVPTTAMTFTDNWAHDLIGGRASAATTPQNGVLGRTPDQMATDVGEQPMTQYTSQTQRGLADTGTLANLASFAKWRDAKLVADVDKRKAELRHKIANQELEVQAAQRDRARVQNELEKSNSAVRQLQDAFSSSLRKGAVNTGAEIVGGFFTGGGPGAARGAGAAVAASGGGIYDAQSKLDEKKKENANLRRSVSWFEKYVDKQLKTLEGYYDELEQME